MGQFKCLEVKTQLEVATRSKTIFQNYSEITQLPEFFNLSVPKVVQIEMEVCKVTPSTGKGFPTFVQQEDEENGQNKPVGRPAALPEVAQHMHHPKNPHRLRDPDNPVQQQSAEQEGQRWAQVRGEWHGKHL